MKDLLSNSLPPAKLPVFRSAVTGTGTAHRGDTPHHPVLAFRRRAAAQAAPGGGTRESAADPARGAARILAFYLPQFHPVAENDAWWGKGFTEWTNVAKARPLFEGHYQPHLPAHLGYYDLRVPEVRQAQAELAARHGIEGFCYWHYWFDGKRLLEKPFNEVLLSGEPHFPVCLAWANETWSRRWLGEERDILQKQSYSFDDDLRHVRWLLRAFDDPRYVRVQGQPLFLIYKPHDLPDPRRTTDIFRNECVRQGLPPPYLVGINAHLRNVDCRTLGFDGTLDFEPQLGVLPGPLEDGLKIYEYVLGRRRMKSRNEAFPLYPSIFVGWDNTPRRGADGIVFINATPENFEAGLAEIVQSVQRRPYEDRLVFVNAWNEWAEGNHLEPDAKYGLRFLEAIRRVNASAETGARFRHEEQP
ncbi:MAG: glycoside hydrolase family 99-like domain-containing protein [Acidobacteria bacterium]|nr:glycoside hydrolase family 99-like domain-containing protein [Acidobacteriota bacterium]